VAIIIINIIDVINKLQQCDLFCVLYCLNYIEAMRGIVE